MRKHLPGLAIFIILIISAWLMKTKRWEGKDGQGWKEQFSTCDAKGYYAYLPEFFLKHDLSHQDSSQAYVNRSSKGYVNKYFIGVSVMWSPFFGAASLYTIIKGEKSEGYTAPFAKMISIAGLFWLFIGLICLSETLKMLCFSPTIRATTLVLITLGTNLFYFSVLEPAMSHLYAFSALSGFLCFAIKYFKNGKTRNLLLASLFLGLCILIRPANIFWIACLLPFMAGGTAFLYKKILQPRTLAAIGITVGGSILLQCGVYYLETGHWFLSTYSGEGFNFTHPVFLKVLFGFQKGWFIYTPMAALALMGFIPLYRQNKTAFYSILSAILLLIYTVASWWSWIYADSFGHRAFIDCYPLVAILLSYVFRDLSGIIRLYIPNIPDFIPRLFIHVFATGFLALNLVQTDQYCNHILHYNSMDLARYKYVFLKTGKEYENCLGGCLDVQPFSAKEPLLIYSTDNDFSSQLPGWSTLPAEPFHGSQAIHFKDGNEYGATLVFPSDSSLHQAEKFYAKVRLTRYERLKNSTAHVMLITQILNSEKRPLYYNGFPINDEPSESDNNLRTFEYTIEIPKQAKSGSELAMYIYNIDKRDFYLCRIKVDLYQIFPRK